VALCKPLCKIGIASGSVRRVEPMFDTKKSFNSWLVDAVDLTIDFATLGEYGLEPVDQPARPCEGRRRSGVVRSTGSWNSAIARFATHS
jgi:hypothetical protein